MNLLPIEYFLTKSFVSEDAALHRFTVSSALPHI